MIPPAGKPAADFPVGEVSGAEIPPTALIAIGPGGCELPLFTGTALPCTDQPLDGGGAGFSRGKSGTIMTTVLSLGFVFDLGGVNPICLGKALATGTAWRASVATLDVRDRNAAAPSECAGAEIAKLKCGRKSVPRSSAINAATALAAITPPASSASRINGRSLKAAI